MPDILDQRISEYSATQQNTLCFLRELVHAVAANTTGCGSIIEALKWNQISFLTQKPKSGTTIRFDQNSSGTISLYVNCNSTLIADIKQHYPTEFEYVGSREVVLPNDLSKCHQELEHMIALALTYHQNKRSKAS
ncbi:DUF1801 domain-containing protein [Maritalea porphyrae]|uniref:DUF1801 domain-containing protein n=1 Tax=Maritalea porphyrae TaxID=880732 RepID=UPI0022AF52F6|nr:DUF1801 domain-containing protein [Maritalea porphyrae]MCZ4273089.1 DUF1801 domain-containing protein [Maritalea porphyrae]